jgi:uncharacterized RDD family membrane protein YckC
MKRLDDVATVETPEQIELELPLAGVGSRAVAYLLDFLIQLIPVVIAMVLLVVALSLDLGLKGSADGIMRGRVPLVAAAVFSAVLFATNFLYFTIWDLAARGQSPGKRALKLRVVRDGGLAIDARSSLIRNLVRTVDMLPGFYVVGLVSVFWSRAHKRIGDLAAGTLVIRDEGAAVGELSVILGPAPSVLAPASALSAADRGLVHDYLERRHGLASATRDRLDRQIADKLAVRYGIDPRLPAAAILDELKGK